MPIFLYSMYFWFSFILIFDFWRACVMLLQALHDGRNVFFLLEVPGEYRYVQG
jgi:hypothetical protein